MKTAPAKRGISFNRTRQGDDLSLRIAGKQYRTHKIVAILFIMSLSLFLTAGQVHAGIYAAAASLQPAMDRIVEAFKAECGFTMKGVYGASGTLARQLDMGAPFDLFLSADERWARYLEDKGKLERVSPLVECPLVLWWSSEKAPLLGLVKDGNVRVAIADPAVAPYGLLAKVYLERIGVYEKLFGAGRLILAGTVLQAALAAKSGGVDAALIPLSVALKLGGTWTRVPVVPTRVFGGLVRGRNTQEAIAFMKFLKGPEAAELFRESGFEPVRP